VLGKETQAENLLCPWFLSLIAESKVNSRWSLVVSRWEITAREASATTLNPWDSRTTID